MIGHINAMPDKDGVLRHHMLTLRLPDGREFPSMALAAVKKYEEFYGMEPLSRPPVSSHGFWYVPFCGLPGDFDESISVVDVLSGEFPMDYFAGKIVLIGPYTPGFQDSYITAADHAWSMYGVEFQANAIQALLWEDYQQEVSSRVQLPVLFALLLLGLAGFWRRQVTSTFKRYVAPEIVNELLKEGGEALELGGRQVEIAVLFVDVRGFTPMSELLEPVQVVEILNRYLSLISECILKNGGTLDKFVGDAAMAFWGAPLPQENYVLHAAQAAMDMVRGSQTLSEELLARYGRTVSFGVGIHTGEAVVGNIGSPQRMDYTAIGDTVNTAARLEANAPGGTVYISRAVADALGKRARTTSLGGSVKLKGKKEGFEILTLDALL